MTIEDLQEAIERLHIDMQKGFDKQNGRVRQNEIDIAILMDRSDRDKKTASKFGGAWGALGGLVGGFVSSWMGGR